MLKTSAWLLALLAVGFLGLRHSVNSFMQTPMALPDAGLEFEIAPGSSFSTVSENLVASGAIESDRWLRLFARYTGQEGEIKAGDYLIAAGATPLDALQQFVRGDVRLYSFTIVEGWNHRELLAALHASEVVTTTMSAADWPDLLTSLGAEYGHPEGLFLPETYRFPKGTRDRDVLRQAYELMQSTLAEEWSQRAEAIGVTSPYETLVLASIVEKETARADERQRIAGVFTRRLAKRMRLQTDPTVIYGIGADFDGNLRRRDLTTDTPYNTYTRHGLPPTPIAMPGRAAIHAALHPAPGEELYFVATGLGDGSHRFSVDKAAHDAAVADYLKQLRKNRQGD